MNESNPSSKRLRVKQKRKRKAAVPPSSQAIPDKDQQSINDFCELTKLEEISFESWQKLHSDLDLQVPLWISRELAQNGGEVVVRCSRSVKGTISGERPIRQPVSLSVSIPPGTIEGSCFTYSGIGDKDAENVGDLIVIVHLK